MATDTVNGHTNIPTNGNVDLLANSVEMDGLITAFRIGLAAVDSSGRLHVGSSTTLDLGTSTTNRALNIVSTSASTDASTSIRPIYMQHTMTGAGGVGGRAEFYMTTNVALGGWSNALKGNVVYGSSGRTTGLGSAVCAEITLSAGTSSGTYAALEAELVLGSGALTGTNTSFLYCNATGAAASTFDTNGLMFEIGTGITPAATKFASATSQTLKCKVEANTRYMVLSQMEDGLGLGVSGTAMSLGTSLTQRAIDVYTTSASTNGSTSVRPIYMESTMTGAGGVGGRAEFYMTTNVALGGWSNALKGYVVYGASGRTTGLGSAVCAEVKLSAGTSSGTYAALEAELEAPTNAVAGTATSFIYMNCVDTAGVINAANGYLFELGSGITDTAGGIFEAETNTDSMSMTHVLKIRIAGTAYYIPLNTSKGF